MAALREDLAGNQRAAFSSFLPSLFCLYDLAGFQAAGQQLVAGVKYGGCTSNQGRTNPW